jgi:ComF family protein
MRLKLPQAESLDTIQAAAEFSFPIDQLIKELKYRRVKNIGVTCGRLIYYAVDLPDAEIITAVPLHRQRQTERRFNQSEVVARELARLLKKPYLPLLARRKNTPHLASISDKSIRAQVITNSFVLNPKYAHLSDQSVLIVDDVVTSGATINECAKTLRNHGFSRVNGVAVAHGG